MSGIVGLANAEDTMESSGSEAAAAQLGETIYTKSAAAEDDDFSENFWDDSALIKAYDKAVSLAYDAVKNGGTSKSGAAAAKSQEKEAAAGGSKDKPSISPQDFQFRMPKPLTVETKSKKKNKAIVWNVGDACDAPYTENGSTEYYWAKIVAITGNQCKVEFDGFEGELHTIAANLLKPQTTSEQADSSQDSAMGEEMPSGCAIPVLPPPPALNWLKGGCTPTHSEAMSSMLMSWYMSGYHTGYYQAMCEMDEQKNKQQTGKNKKRNKKAASKD